MPTIYDNITMPFLENDQGNGLRDALKLALRGDFCVGYFNLRGWRSIDDVVESWPQSSSPPCRLLVGMTVTWDWPRITGKSSSLPNRPPCDHAPSICGDIASNGDFNKRNAYLRRHRRPTIRKCYVQKDHITIEERSCRQIKELARQNQASGFDLNAWIPAWESAGSGRQIPGRN